MTIRMSRAWCAVVLLALTVGSAFAQDKKAPPFKATDYPIEVRKVLSSAVVYCRQQDGGRVEFAPDTVAKVDFNGDGQDDYVVDFEKITCPDMEHIFCGTGGCLTNFLVTLPNGTIRSLFADPIHNYEILPGNGPRKVRFWVHHSRCEGDPTKGCFKDIRISYKPFSTKRG